jgi:hypothetical protein
MGDSTFKPADKIEQLVHESLDELHLTDGLVERVSAAIPPIQQMQPSLHPALRMGFGVTAAAFAASAWLVNLPRVYGASTVATYIGLTAIMLGAAIGSTAIAIAVFREAGARAFATMRGVLSGHAGNALVGTIAAAALLGTAYVLLGSFPADYLQAGLRAARSSAATLLFVLIAAAAVQIWILARGKEWRPALRLVEAAGLVVAAVACVANYAIFIA